MRCAVMYYIVMSGDALRCIVMSGDALYCDEW